MDRPVLDSDAFNDDDDDDGDDDDDAAFSFKHFSSFQSECFDKEYVSKNTDSFSFSWRSFWSISRIVASAMDLKQFLKSLA